MTPDIRFASAPALAPSAGPTRPAIAAVRVSRGIAFVSGQTAVGQDGSLIASGLVGADVNMVTARQCAWQCAANVVAALHSQLTTLADVKSILKMRVYVASAPGFTDQHLVADAGTHYMLEVFGEHVGQHARAAIGVACLPTGSPVEIEAEFEIAG